MFSYDLLLFGRASKNQTVHVLNVFQNFGDISSQKLSNEKTSIMLSKNTNNQIRRQLVHLSGFKEYKSKTSSSSKETIL